MPIEPTVIEGVVRGGVIVPNGGVRLPEGRIVRITLPSPDTSDELLVEFEAWEQASDDAWAMIDEWEKEAQP